MTPEPKPGDIVGVRVANRTHHNPNWVWCSETFPGGVGFFGAPRSALVPLPPEITPTAQAVVTAAMEEQEAHKLLVPRAERYMLPRESWTPTAKALWRACEAHAKTLPKPDPKREAVERAIIILHTVSFGETSQVIAASKLRDASDAAAALEAAFREGGK